ncbi:MAG: hypothetical protein V4582_09240 [Pseudomonadota bacterium]
MLGKIAFIVISASIGHTVVAADACATPDANFGTFLKKFKNDRQFRASRIVFPLQVAYTEPGGTTTESITLQQFQERKMGLIRGDQEARALAGGEGALCESDPVVKKNEAVFGQYSCGTDVYSDEYHFINTNGCWMLTRLAASGG